MPPSGDAVTESNTVSPDIWWIIVDSTFNAAKYWGSFELVVGSSNRLEIDTTLSLGLFFPSSTLKFNDYWRIYSTETVIGSIFIADLSFQYGIGDCIWYLRSQIAAAFTYRLPSIVAVHNYDHPDAWELDMLRIAANIPKDIPIVPYNPKDKESVKNVVLTLLYRVCEYWDLACEDTSP